MDVITVIVIIALVGNLSLGVFTLLKNWKSATNILFFLFSLSIAGYIYLNQLALISSIDQVSFFWTKGVMALASIINLLFFLLASVFPKNKLTTNSALLGFYLLFTAAVVYLALNNYVFVSGKAFVKDTIPGSGMPLFLWNTFFFLGFGFILLVNKYRKFRGVEKDQVAFFLLGSVVMFALILLTNVIFVLVLHTQAFAGLLPIYMLLFLGIISYAIVRHEFLDIRLVLARSFLYIVLLTVLSLLFIAPLFVIGDLFFNNRILLSQAFIYAILALVIAVIYQPLRLYFETITDKLFFKGKYSSNELVFHLTQIMASTLLLSDLTKLTLNQLLETMRITRGAFILFNEDKQLQLSDTTHAEDIKLHTETVKKLFALKRIIIFDEEEDEKIKQLMRDVNILVAVPLYEDDHTEGLLVLGEKKSGEIYSQQDKEVLEIFGPEVSVALRNAASYEEISRFNITLKQEIDRATKDLKTANEKLKALDKLKNEFVSVASHELRTPMTAIKSYLWMALNGKGGKLNEKQKYYVERGYNSVDRLIRLVNDMLNISRIESGRITINFGATDLIKITQEVIDEVMPRANELGIKLTLQKSGSVPPVLADSDKIKEVLFNLIGNSLKFTPKGGTITVSFFPKGGFIETRVIDTGAGIAKEDLGKLFQKFGLIEGSYITNQTSTSMGTGLGLFICRSIIDLHHGEIKASSPGRGKGSTVSFTLKVFTKADSHSLKKQMSGDNSDHVDLIHAQI